MLAPRVARRFPTLVVAVLLAAGLARLLVSTVLVPAWENRTRRAPFPDLYPTLAASLVDIHTLGYTPVGARITTGRGPGFPAWLAVPMLMRLRGDRWIAWWATVPGLLGGALAAYAYVRFSRRGGTCFAACAAAFATLHPLPMFMSSRALSDEFCGVAGLAGLVGWRLSQNEPRRVVWYTAASGLALAVAILSRATSVLFVIGIVTASLLTGTFGRRVLAIASLALIPPVGWSIRSSALEGRPVFVHSLGAYNFWLGEAKDRFGFGPFGRARADAHALMATESGMAKNATAKLWHAALTPKETAQLETILTRTAIARILRNPVSYLRRVLTGLGWFWIRAETWAPTAAYAVVVLPFLFLVLVGAFAAASRPVDSFELALLLTVGLHVLFYAAICAMARYSVVVYPCCALLAARGLREFWQRRRGAAC